MIDKMKEFFADSCLTRTMRKAVKKAKTVDDLIDILEDLKTENEDELNIIDEDVDTISRAIRLEHDYLKAYKLDERKKKLILQRINRYENEMSIIDQRIDIHNKNITLLQNIIGKITIMESMAMQGLDDGQIDQVVVEFQSMMDQYNDIVEADSASRKIAHSILTVHDKQKLQSIEDELLKPAKIITTPVVSEKVEYDA